MLEHLRVSNLGVVRDALVDPSPAFTVVTGETGAGKTLLLGGLRLVLGGAADSSAVGPYGDEARVDGLFQTDDHEIGASRTIPRSGRSRAYLEGAIVSAAALQEQLGQLVEIVGQHDQLQLTRPSHVLEIVDGALDGDGLTARQAYRTAWESLQTAKERQLQLGGDRMALVRELDLARYQANEIETARLAPGLDEDLEVSVSRRRNVEEIREHLAELMRLAETMSEASGEMVARLRKASGLDPSLVGLSAQAEGLAAAVGEVASEARVAGEDLEVDPERLVEMEDRLTAIGELKRKYGRTMEEVLEYGESTARRVTEIESLLEDADRIDTLITDSLRQVDTRGADLREARIMAGRMIADAAKSHLGDLGLGSAQLILSVSAVEPGPSGADRVELLFASDSRLQPGTVGSVASGGELSRLVLALRLATGNLTTGTLVFDEVDTGIGGATALAMGAKLAELGRSRQVLCVTHLPQVAARADTHYVVERDDGGVATVRQVDGEDRVAEISRMMAGQPESVAGKTAAAELLAGDF